jgi:hypothetical protein
VAFDHDNSRGGLLKPIRITMTRLRTAITFTVLAAVCPDWALAQATQDRFQAGGQVVVARSQEFEETDIGVGGRFSWHPAGLIGVEAEIDVYPRNFPDGTAFSRGRVEGLFGATVGPRFGGVRPFARLRPGFLTFREASQPFACILIFPPPLSCTLSGRTVFAFDIGGGIELYPTRKTFVRVDVGDRLLKYPGPAFDRERVVRQESFYSHDLRFAAGAGVRF